MMWERWERATKGRDKTMIWYGESVAIEKEYPHGAVRSAGCRGGAEAGL